MSIPIPQSYEKTVKRDWKFRQNKPSPEPRQRGEAKRQSANSVMLDN
jgi:hypothetical protein